MTWLVAIGLTNAVLAGILAVLAWSVGRYIRRPALARLLWIVVLCKLFAPPLAKAPIGDWLATPSRWLADLTAATNSAAPDQADFAAGPLNPERSYPTSRTATGAEDLAASSQTSIAGSNAAIPRPTVTAGSRSAERRSDILTRLAAVSPTTYLRKVAVVWTAGSTLLVVWFAWRVWRFRRFLARAAHEDAGLTQRVAQLAKEAGLQSAPRVLVVDSAVSPMLWGAGRAACLLFPTELARRIDEDACDALLLHELAHYARADWLVRILELAAQAAYWWHPLVWWACREIEAVEEECCDAWVVSRRTGSRRVYAQALLATVDFLCEPLTPLPPAACGLGAAPLLRSRLTQIMCGDVALRPSRTAKVLVLVGAAIALPISPSIVGTSPQEAQAGSTPPSAMEPMVPLLPVAIEKLENVRDMTDITSVETPSKSWFVAREPLTPRMTATLYATAVSPNGRYKLEARTGHRVALIDVERNSHLDLTSYRILSASFSPDSNFLVTGQDDESTVRLWNCENGEVRRLFKGSEAAITSVAFAPDGLRVAAGAADGSVLVWNLDDEEFVARLPRRDVSVSCLRWSKQGDRLAIASGDWSNRDSSSLVIWQPTQETVTSELSLDHATGAVDWLTDDELVVADWNGDARVMGLASGIAVERLWLDKDTVSAAAFSSDCPLVPRWQAASGPTSELQSTEVDQ